MMKRTNIKTAFQLKMFVDSAFILNICINEGSTSKKEGDLHGFRSFNRKSFTNP